MISRSELVENAARLKLSPESLDVYLKAGHGVLVRGARRRMHAMAKPCGSSCNLNCTYCYYLGKQELFGYRKRCMPDETLERFIESYISGQEAEEIPFIWQGGEPTLLGLDYFRLVLELQAKHTPTGRRITNDLQTNGTLLDDEWCSFLKENGFLVGLSIDGPRDIHEAYRPTRRGESSFDAVMAAIERLHRHGVPFNTLTVVNRLSAKHPLEVYRFLRDQVGSTRMQFLPCVEPRQFQKVAPGCEEIGTLPLAGSPRANPDHPESVVTPWSVDPDDWGEFLCHILDEWLATDRETVRVNHFDTAIEQIAGRPPLHCTSSPHCGKNVTVEHDGRVYSCDHYVYPEYELGSVLERPLSEMVFSLRQLEFGLNKCNTLPGECRQCRHLNLCWGDCPRMRLLRTRAGEGNLSYLCSGWKRFFEHATPELLPVAWDRSHH